MKTLSISEVRSHLPSVVEAVSQVNESVLITRYGKPVASIVPFRNKNTDDTTRYPLRDQQINVSDSFDEPIPELWNALEAKRPAGRAARRGSPRRAMPGRHKKR